MSQVRYIISDASKKIDVEPHVLRYWEEELGVKVPRNEMGHRYYREEDIELFKSIKFLKEQGFQLRAIKMVLSDVRKIGQLDKKKMNMLKDELNAQVLCMDQTASEHVEKKEDSIMGQAFEAQKETMENEVCAASPEPVDTQSEPKVAQFKVIMNNIIMEALRENNLELSKAVSSNVSESVLKEMDYMMRMKEEREEERFKRLDDSIRSKQKARKEISATREKRKKKRMFHKKAE
ncbi:MerR family transcriptional regulator [[Clostridium] polysaccharolyticum]|uniref:DNA-binding transcriptional regulator, MerR family n=1 Tax=[Clostridium] polysaccharolyticum TaxID=29364 RepID=A0A1I0BQG0_9FIRM|nr:MerR family transcriptional regulator [[Clostridium] polysaccharolyticum]SET08866.1 DNA-binding transcriptional regulator, MerR family [[Clostridium] polysaccharolyticum]